MNSEDFCLFFVQIKQKLSELSLFKVFTPQHNQNSSEIAASAPNITLSRQFPLSAILLKQAIQEKELFPGKQRLQNAAEVALCLLRNQRAWS